MDVLSNKTYKEYATLSRYSSFPVYYNNLWEKYVTGTTSYLDDTTAYTLYKVVRGDTYDSIALAFYNNPTYYWIICNYNRVRDCFVSPVPGTYLKIPNVSKIEFLN